MRPWKIASLLGLTLFGGLGACGGSASGGSDQNVAGSSAMSGGGSGGSGGSNGLSARAGGSGSGGVASGGVASGGVASGGVASGGVASGGAGAGGAGLVCDAPRCIKLCEGGDCTCSCEGTAGSAGMAGAGGSNCTTLDTARAQALKTAAACVPEVDGQCKTIVTVPNQCGCPSLVNSARPDLIMAAQQAYDSWVAAGCGPYPCGAACLMGIASKCYAPSVGSAACSWSAQ